MSLSTCLCRGMLICLMAGVVANARGQIAERVFRSDTRIDPSRKGELRVGLDHISFFRDNEFSTSTMDGYTLPGLWVRPKFSFQPLYNIKVEAGVHLLRYWGTDRYPNMAYQDIATWKGGKQHGFHVLPYFRAQVALSEHVDLLLGDLYGGANHRLAIPLYCPELNLTADPEVGLQLLYHSRSFDLDAWVNWESFIFRQDVHQEAFLFGLSGRVKFNPETSRLHFYLPVQLLAQHRGGEIDTLQSNSVQTLMNGAVGLGMSWRVGHRYLERVEAEVDALGYYQQAGRLWPFGKGAAFYGQVSAALRDFVVKGGLFYGHRFISLLGYPFYGTVSTKEPGVTYEHSVTGTLGAEYAYTFAPGYALGIDVELFLQPARTARLASGTSRREGFSSSFAAGVYLRMDPSFLIKSWNDGQ